MAESRRRDDHGGRARGSHGEEHATIMEAAWLTVPAVAHAMGTGMGRATVTELACVMVMAVSAEGRATVTRKRA